MRKATRNQVAFFVFDFDVNYGAPARVQRIDILDAVTETLLHTITVNSFSPGKYIVYNVSGQIKARFTKISGYNSVLSGYFIDPASP